ncbi:Actin family protein [Tritrichomonas foetus]|uniref:Actin family protein n=1 Tax=Tritrichomonas foetus TaxID=1144522 RepID=A0A1J4KFG0_9EUKA|nr:Actin family protein [Tritrichomonas foetus]|eukprot:OHT08334.1 Actin family protein [Tritrichomonas foetus]
MNCEPNIYSTVVYDIGSAMIRVGHAGEGFPVISQPSFVANKTVDENIEFYYNDQFLYTTSNKYEVAPLIDESYTISDAGLFSSFLSWSYDQLSVDPRERFCLFTQPAHLVSTDHSRQWQKTLCEIGFEAMGNPGICISPDATLSTYAHCLQTALVVDFGWSSFRILPVIDGKVQYANAKIHPIGGFGLSQLLCEQLNVRSISLLPKNADISDGQNLLHQRKLSTDIIHNCCTFAKNTIEEDFLYFLPEQRPIDVKSEMQLISALHFNPIDSDDTTENVLPVPEMIKMAIDESPDDQKRDLWKNIVSSGGFSSLNSFIAKLKNETKKIADPVFQVQVQYPMHKMVAGDFLVWTGGSILASSHVFDRFCITKEEWEENGEAIMRVKCT